MTTFIEILDSEGFKHLINTEKILEVEEDEDGTAYIRMIISSFNTRDNYKTIASDILRYVNTDKGNLLSAIRAGSLFKGA